MLNSEYYQKQLDNQEYWKSKEKEIAEEISKTPFIQKLKEKYRTNDVGHLVNSIARKKVQLHTSAEYLGKQYEEFHLQYVAYAHKLLNMILSKKLFNMECLWRAEDIQIEGIEFTSDFWHWSRNLNNCPFLEPITNQELQILKMFMKSSEFEMKERVWEVREYDYETYQMKNERGDKDRMPAFFEYYDSMMGTFYLLTKPDVRKEKEEKYAELYYEVLNKQREEKHAARLALGLLPTFDSHGADGKALLKQLEPEDFQELQDAFEQRTDLMENLRRIGINETWSYLMLFKDEIFLPGYLQWDEAMEFAYNRHRNEKAAEVLDLAYEEYLLKAELGLYDTANTKAEIEADTWRDYVKKGMQLAGF